MPADLDFIKGWRNLLRSFLLAAPFLVLIACDATQQSLAAPSSELSAQLNRVVEDLNSRDVQRLSVELTFVGAMRSENALQLELLMEQSLAERVRRASRGELAVLVERDWRPATCSTPEYRETIALGGRIETQFVDQFGRNLFSIAIDHCPRI